jgi:ABC-type molybdenum transport system ATPase subunit/photorepair protein PhrA
MTDPIIFLQDVTFTYEGEVVALKNLNLSARRVWVVLGANGAGKSTLCYLLSGIAPHITVVGVGTALGRRAGSLDEPST